MAGNRTFATPTDEIVSRNVSSWMRVNDVSLKELAYRTKIHVNTISRLINGGNVYLGTVEIIAEAMGIPAWALMVKNGWEAMSVVTFVELMTPEDAKLFAMLADRLTRSDVC